MERPMEMVEFTNLCMIMDDQGQVLVEEKRYGDGQKGLILPGGHAEPGEALADSVIREIREETGLIIDNVILCGVKDWLREDGSRYMVFIYKTKTFSGKLISSEEGDVFWMPLCELKKKPMLWNLEMMLDILEQEQYSELYYREDLTPDGPVLK